MADEAKKGITVKVDAKLHAQVSQYLKEHGMTMAEFVSMALDNELHPKIQMEDRKMEKMRTLAIQIPEDLFQRIKEYLQRNNLSQKEFVIGLIETELDRDLAQREAERTVENASAAPDVETAGPEELADMGRFEAPSGEEESPADRQEYEAMDMDLSMGM